MKINPRRFEHLLLELIDENPLACQGVLSILQIEYTDRVPTLAVSLEAPPRLLVNLDFLAAHATREIHIKSVLLHEFLHVLLNHTEQFTQMDRATNIALDAIINHIIHRLQGADYSEFFRLYYKDQRGYASLLRPEPQRSITPSDNLHTLHRDLLGGLVVVDDLLDLTQRIRREQPGQTGAGTQLGGGKTFLGNHEDNRGKGPAAKRAQAALQETLQSSNGHGIYRSPKTRGLGADPYPQRCAAKDENLVRWEHSTWKILQALCTTDPQTTLKETVDQSILLPVLNTRDRRAFFKTIWNPLIPEVSWSISRDKPLGTTVVYLDVSGSMQAEMQALVELLRRLIRYIRKPLWAFSDRVAPAVIRDGVLETSTSGGTSINSVLAHFADSAPDRAVVITDGYIEQCDTALLNRLRNKTLQAIVSRAGSTGPLDRAGIPCYQLAPYPADRVLNQGAST